MGWALRIYISFLIKSILKQIRTYTRTKSIISNIMFEEDKDNFLLVLLIKNLIRKGISWFIYDIQTLKIQIFSPIL